jgi:biopolymer transport protein ExbD
MRILLMISLLMWNLAIAEQQPVSLPTNTNHGFTQLVVDVNSSPDRGTEYSAGGVDYPTVNAIQHLLEDKYRTDPQLNVVIQADTSVAYAGITRLLDVFKEIGIQRVSFATFTPVAQTLLPEGQVVAELSQENAFAGVAQDVGEPNVLQIFNSQPFPLWEIKDPKITANRYAVVGEIRYQNVSNGYLEMSSEFAPEDPGGSSTWFYTRTEDDQGPFARLKGTSDWRPFWLPFDSSKIENRTRLKRLQISLGLADEGTVYVRNVKLVQYPSETFPTPLAPSGTIPPPQLPSGESAFQKQNPSAQVPVESKRTTGIDWKSFLLGMAATGMSLLAGGGIIFISRRWNRRRHERELRRIASLDS